MTTTTHTAATLAALAPSELDALAYFYVLGRGVVGMRNGEPIVIPMQNYDGPQFSTSRNAAALLEAELARRGIMPQYNMTLCGNVGFDITLRPDNYCQTIQDGAYYDPVDPAWLTSIIRASAKDRTIAAVLAVQDSPYLQIVTWDKHPKDAANSQ